MTQRPLDDFLWLPQALGGLGAGGSKLAHPQRIEFSLSAGQLLSGIRWGEEPIDVVFLHGGGQNAHTWDLVAALVGASSLAIDLPGHGHSSWRDDKDYRPVTHARAIQEALSLAGFQPKLVVGMSLGGLTSLALATLAPQLVPALVLVDILPQVAKAATPYDRSKLGQVALIDGPRTFTSFDAMVAAAVAVTSPNRPIETLRRGVWHNAIQLADGRWRWRYDDLGSSLTLDHDGLWESLVRGPEQLTVVKGALSPLLSEPTLDRLRADRPDAEVLVVPRAGHAVQSDEPELLAGIVRNRVGSDRASSSESF